MMRHLGNLKKIRRQAADKLPRFLIVVIFIGLCLKVGKQFPPHIRLDIDPQLVTKKDHDVLQHRIQYIKKQKGKASQQNRAEFPFRHDLVDHLIDRDRKGQLQ